jgi:hypothetical protein
VDRVGQAGTQEINHRGDLVVGGGDIQAAVEIENRLAGRQIFDPEFRDLALVQFVVFRFGVLGEDQGVEAVAVVDLADYPHPANLSLAAGLGDLYVDITRNFAHLNNPKKAA